MSLTYETSNLGVPLALTQAFLIHFKYFVSPVLINVFHVINKGFKLRTFKLLHQNKLIMYYYKKCLFPSDFQIQCYEFKVDHTIFHFSYIFLHQFSRVKREFNFWDKRYNTAMKGSDPFEQPPTAGWN